jgi:choline dehydrogenase-like flavoprotein
MTNSSGITSADYIVVGGGIAGCAVAVRLQGKLPFASILLIEAGRDPSDDPEAQNAAGAHPVRHSDLAWHLGVTLNLHLGGRSTTAGIGKALGGGGAVNGGGTDPR